MLYRLTLCLVVLSLATASAATYKVTLFQPSVIQGTELKAGEYKVDVTDQKAVLMNGKTPIELSARVENGEQKFSSTTVRYSEHNGKQSVAEIRLGGSKTKLVFNQ